MHGDIAGRVRILTTHQLIMAWWLHQAGYLTRRQLRVTFALHEMHERRMFARQDEQRGRCKPFYGVEELRPLIGRDTPLAELRADVRALSRIGLALMDEQAITFAVSIDQITLPAGPAEEGREDHDPLDGFWTMLSSIPKANRRRAIPVPRRTLRALAGGFSRGTTAVMLAMLIRCLFRHGGAAGQGGRYRIDGRTKGSWIAETFGVSRRAVTEGRQRLIELGWMVPLDCSQIEMNRWGTRDRLNPDWRPAREPDAPAEQPSPFEEAKRNLLAPEAEIESKSASPLSNRNTSNENQNQNTRPCPPAPASGSCQKVIRRRGGRGSPESGPVLRDVQARDLASDAALAELHRQAIAAGKWGGSEADRLDFFALAERARAIGNQPGAMFAWLIAEQKKSFITQADEDRAAERLRAIRNGPARSRTSGDPPPRRQGDIVLDEEGRLVCGILLAAKKHRVRDPFTIVRKIKPHWTRAEWQAAVDRYEEAELAKMRKQITANDPELATAWKPLA
jgi:hypothetical protein